MNYFEDHIGDYAAATAHLTWDEDMAYTRLIRAYYHAEKPIPKGQGYRLARATTPAQRKAVDAVLAEFFTLEDDGYHQKRCDEEIARYQDKQAKAKRSAQARWSAKPPQSEGNANAHANASPDAMRTHMRTHSEGNAHQTPDTRHQTPDPNTHTPSTSTVAVRVLGDPQPDPPQAPTRAGHLCRLMRQAGIPDTNPGHPDLIALADAGVTDAEAQGAAQTAKERGKGFAYAIGTLKRQRVEAAQAAQQMHRGALPQRQPTQSELNALAQGFATGVYGPATFDPEPQPEPETVDVESRLIAP